MTPDDTGPTHLRAGTVGRPHGLDGSFHVARVAADVFSRISVGSLVRVAGQQRRVVRQAGHAARPLLRVEGCDSREQAEALTGSELEVARADLGELGEDEWWAEDLEGCTVLGGAKEIGVVAALVALPSCEVLEVARPGDAPGRPLLVPLVSDAVLEVDIERRVIEVDLRFLGEEA